MYCSSMPCASPILSLKTSSPFSPGFRTFGITLATVCRFPTLSVPVPALWNVKVPVRESTSDVVPKSYTVLSNWIFGDRTDGLAGTAWLFVADFGARGSENTVILFVPSARAMPIDAIVTSATASNSRLLADINFTVHIVSVVTVLASRFRDLSFASRWSQRRGPPFSCPLRNQSQPTCSLSRIRKTEVTAGACRRGIIDSPDRRCCISTKPRPACPYRRYSSLVMSSPSGSFTVRSASASLPFRSVTLCPKRKTEPTL